MGDSVSHDRMSYLFTKYPRLLRRTPLILISSQYNLNWHRFSEALGIYKENRMKKLFLSLVIFTTSVLALADQTLVAAEGFEMPNIWGRSAV